MAESYTPVARSAIGMAVRAGAPKPDISTVDALKRTLLQAKSIAYSASVSGDYLTTELYQRLGIADQVMSKSRLIGGGERVGAVVARGEAEIGFQQISELLPVPGIDHVTPLPPEVQKVSVFSAGVAPSTSDSDAAHAIIRFLASPEAAARHHEKRVGADRKSLKPKDDSSRRTRSRRAPLRESQVEAVHVMKCDRKTGLRVFTSL